MSVGSVAEVNEEGRVTPGHASRGSGAGGRARRMVSLIAVIGGLALIVFTFASASFLRTGDGERVLGRFATVTTAPGFAAFHAAYAETATAVDELVNKDYPRFARDFGMSTPQFDSFVRSNFSAVDYGVRTVDALPSLIDPVANGVAALPDGKFGPVYALPVKGVSLTAVPWLLLGLGALLVAGGVCVPRRRAAWPVAAVLVVGAAMVVVPLAISLPSKVSQTSRVIALASVGLSTNSATRSEQASYAADSMVRELHAGLLPAVAKRRSLTPTALDQQLSAQSPALTRFLADWPKLAPANFAFAAAIRESVGEFAEAKRFPFESVPWLLIALGGLLVIVAGGALATTRERPLGGRLLSAAP